MKASSRVPAAMCDRLLPGEVICHLHLVMDADYLPLHDVEGIESCIQARGYAVAFEVSARRSTNANATIASLGATSGADVAVDAVLDASEDTADDVGTGEGERAASCLTGSSFTPSTGVPLA